MRQALPEPHLFGEEGEIRTLVPCHQGKHLSRVPLSATQPPLHMQSFLLSVFILNRLLAQQNTCTSTEPRVYLRDSYLLFLSSIAHFYAGELILALIEGFEPP